ncbi:MAG: MBL fold metallo-hydrolase [Crocinitomicaceae bacterium]|nr:MBL fold metallo-hydrolase [Crocinitomicaceae bacterium]
MKLTITGYSTALFSTWFFVDELNLLFDAGDGLTSGLLGKSGKIKNVFISHADRDHLMGLFQFNQLNARKGYPIIHYPKDCGSFPALKAFSEKFDPQISEITWKGIQSMDEIPTKDGVIVQAIRNEHVIAPVDSYKSLSYKVFETKRKLRTELQTSSKEEIRKIATEKGSDFVSQEIRKNIFSFSGDTPISTPDMWNNSEILIHEATFIESIDQGNVSPHGNKHSTLEQVLEMVTHTNVEQLILSHFSSRYSSEQIDKSIRSLCTKFNIKIPVRRILPGTIHRNILNQTPINE